MQQHIAQYSGHVIDITANDSISSNAALAAERKIKKAKPTITLLQTNKPEKKPGFFKGFLVKKINKLHEN